MEPKAKRTLLERIIPKRIYEPIHSPSGIRILRLEPGVKGDRIRCSLEHVDLATFPVFEAVSYAWGDAKDRRSIRCNGRRIKITRSLFEALTMFRYPDRARYLWADAVCINQRDVQERNAQVQLMARIYSGAEKVLVWLGHHHAETIRLALEYLCHVVASNDTDEELDADAQDAMSHNAAIYTLEGQRLCIVPDEDYPGLFDMNIADAVSCLYSCAYFRRGWVIQEIALSSTVVVHWGHAQIDFYLLGSATKILYNRISEWKALSYDATTGAIAVRNMYYIYFDQYAPGMPLQTYLHMTRRALFSDPRDKVYGFLGLRTLDCNPLQGDFFIKADYGIPKLQCYQAVAEKYLIQQQSLSILSYVHHERVMHKDWPSWVPDWTIYVSNPIETYVWRTGGDQAARVSKAVRSGRECISMRGIAIDVVEQIAGASIPPGERSNIGAKHLHAILLRLGDRFDMADIAWTTVVGRNTYNQRTITHPSADDTARLLSQYYRFMDWDFEDETLPIDVYIAFHAALSSRVLFTTQGGRLGVAPEIVQPGDVVVVLFGSVLSILRPVADLWRFVGECYVHGIMQGQAVEQWKESGSSAMDFCIY